MMDAVILPMHPEGRKFVAIFAAAALILGLIWEPLFWAGLGLTIWCYYFFAIRSAWCPRVTILLFRRLMASYH